MRQSRNTAETRAKQKRKGANVQRRKSAKAKIGRVLWQEKEEKEHERSAGGKRYYIGSARVRGARGDGSHVHTKRDAHLASLTPLIGAAQARGCARRARAQQRSRGATQARGEHRARHVTKAAYTIISV